MTPEQARQSLVNWQQAYDRVSKGLTFQMNGRTLTRADAADCAAEIQRLQRIINNDRIRKRGGSGGAALAKF